jgi:Putative DNA-binding domain
LIPERLETWDIDALNRLVNLKDIESEEFDFKGPEYRELANHICAMANTSGGYLVLGIDENKNEKTNYFIGFKKKGFKVGEEKNVETQINNATINVEPYPKLDFKYIVDGKKFYPVIKIESINHQKPYFVKGSGVCYIRAGKSTTPASRSTVINLLSNHFQRKNSILRLRAACRDLIEQIQYTSEDIELANPREVLNMIKPLNLNFLQNSVLDTDWLLLQNNLYGAHIDEYSDVGGYYSFYNKLERLNLAIDTFNRSIDTFNQEFIFQKREEIKRNNMRFWHPSGVDSKKAILFLERIITLCDKFEN